MTSLEELLGIDPTSPEAVRAERLAMNDRALLRELVAIRKARKLSQAKVGEIMGISQPSVADFEAHDSNPTLGKIRRYAQAVEALIVHKVAMDEGQLLDSTQREEWIPTSIRSTPIADVGDFNQVAKGVLVLLPPGEARFRDGSSTISEGRRYFALAA